MPVGVDLSSEATIVVDANGTLTMWYRHRGESVGLNTVTPPGAVTLAVAVGLLLGIGLYRYVCTFVSASGETLASAEATVTTTAGNQQVAVSAIPLGPAGTTQRKLYRTKVNGAIGSELLLTTINDNVTTVFTDAIADSLLGATAMPTVTDYSDAIQFGDYFVRQSIVRDLPDTDLDVVKDWDNWRNMTLIDMQAKGLAREANVQIITPVAPVSGVATQYFFTLNSDLRRVTRVELFKTTGNKEYWTSIRNWQQRGRQLRLVRPDPKWEYHVYGRGELRDLNDLDDELFGVLYWGMRMRYFLKRIGDRVNFRPYLSRTRQSDTTSVNELQKLANEAKKMYDEAILNTLSTEGIPDAGPS
jgi:hypothetical protein